jgi:hypothetical protein
MDTHNAKSPRSQKLELILSDPQLRSLYHHSILQRIMQPSTASSLPQHSDNVQKGDQNFENIDLDDAPFPKYLPLRPDKASFWRKPIVLIGIGSILFTLMITGVTIGSIFVGREMQKAKYRNMPTAVIKSPTTIMITHTRVVADYSIYTDMRLQSTVVVTATEYFRPAVTSTAQSSPSPSPPASSTVAPLPSATIDAPRPNPSDCSQIGLWSLDEAECKDLCGKMVGKTFKTSECKSNGRFWRCVLCP